MSAEHVAIWFGILVLIVVEVGLITPPVGMNVFIIRSVASKYVSLTQIFAGVVPFILADIVVVTLIITIPGIVLFLPQLLG